MQPATFGPEVSQLGVHEPLRVWREPLKKDVCLRIYFGDAGSNVLEFSLRVESLGADLFLDHLSENCLAFALEKGLQAGHVLEVVEIDHEHRAVRPVTRHALGLLGQLLLKSPSVEQTGQEIVIDQVLQASRQLSPFRDVLNLLDDIERLASSITNERHGHEHPVVMPPRVAISLLDLEAWNLALEELAHGIGVAIDVLGMRDGLKRRGLQRVPCMTGDPAEGIVHLKPAAVHVDEGHADGRARERALESRPNLVKIQLSGAPLVLQTFVSRNLTDQLRIRGDERPCRLLELEDLALEDRFVTCRLGRGAD